MNQRLPPRLLLPYVERNARVFQCPEGIDTTPGSPTFGKPFQVGYAMSPAIGGKRLTDPGVGSFAWDHMDLPSCPSAAAHWAPWPADLATASARHAPTRHGGVLNSLGPDGHVWAHRP